MEESQWFSIHFLDGSEKRFHFRDTIVDLIDLSTIIDKAIESNKLVVEFDGQMFIFPYSNIKYVQFSPSPALLPDITVRGVERIVDL